MKKKTAKKPAKTERKEQWACITVPRGTRTLIEHVAVSENRTVPQMIRTMFEFWIRLHCPECQREVLSGTCQCQKPGV